MTNDELHTKSSGMQDWFGLSYASWMTIPRVLMEAMPVEWQDKMAKLLEEYEDAFPNRPDIGTRVQAVGSDGKLTCIPEWLKNYRRPDTHAIELCKGGK
jgi:hypothetical protein